MCVVRIGEARPAARDRRFLKLASVVVWQQQFAQSIACGFGRGGDQVRMLEAGYPSVRVTEAQENYTRQHQDLRTENGVRYGDTIDGVNFAYLAQVTRLNVVSMAALACAPAPPSGVEIEGAATPDTTMRWQPVTGAVGYRVWWRSTTDP